MSLFEDLKKDVSKKVTAAALAGAMLAGSASLTGCDDNHKDGDTRSAEWGNAKTTVVYVDTDGNGFVDQEDVTVIVDGKEYKTSVSIQEESQQEETKQEEIQDETPYLVKYEKDKDGNHTYTFSDGDKATVVDGKLYGPTGNFIGTVVSLTDNSISYFDEDANLGVNPNTTDVSSDDIICVPDLKDGEKAYVDGEETLSDDFSRAMGD